MTRSVKQGGPNSAFLFLILAEIFAISLRENIKIKGFTIKEIHDFLNQFADDTDLLLKGTQECVSEVFEVISKYEKISGMKINYDKTVIYRFGSIKNSNAKFYVERNVNWKNDSINVLGVEVCQEKNKLININYEVVLKKVQSTLNAWKHRNLSLLAKITVINVLTASLFVYKMTVLPSITTKWINMYEKMISDFIWNGRKAKIPLIKLQASVNFGGAKLINVWIKDDSLKSSWVKHISEDKFLRILAFQHLDPNMEERIFDCNISENDIKVIFKDSFWRDVLIAWAKIKYNHDPPLDQIKNQHIWYNSQIKHDGRVFKSNKGVRNNLLRIRDLLDAENTRFLPAEAIADRYNIDVMMVNQILSAIPKDWKKKATTPNAFPEITLYEKFKAHPHPTKFYYNTRLEQSNQDNVFNAYAKWQSRLHSDLSYKNFLKLFKKIRLITNHTKLRSFQFRLLHNAIITNEHLKHYGITETNLCSFCNREKETIVHLLFDCNEVKEIWEKIEQFIKITFNYTVKLTAAKIIYNNVHEDATNVINFIVLVVKTRLYVTRCLKQRLCAKSIFEFINQCKNIEKFNAIASKNIVKHANKWKELENSKPVHEIFDYLNIDTFDEQYIRENIFFN